MGMTDGMAYLVAVTQMKANNANDQALHGAEDQRTLVKQQELLRKAQEQFESKVRDKGLSNTDLNEISKIYTALNEGIGAGTVNFGNRTVKGDGGDGVVNADKIDDPNQKDNIATIDGIRSELDKAMKGLEAKDRMGNFEIQRLMSGFNQAETLSSNVQKKVDDTISGQQQKIG